MDVPKSLEEFIEIIRLTPRSILPERDRERIAAVMSFETRMVGELMIPRSKMVFVKDDEMLGPLTLDKLYKSGFTNFPVINSKEKVVGILNTEALNALEVRKLEKAGKYMDKNVRDLLATDTLPHVVDEMKQTGTNYFLVRNNGEVVGFFTVQMLIDYLLGKNVV